MAINVRLETVLTLLKGLVSAILITLGGMLALSVIVIFLPVSDVLLLVMNQLLKIASIFLGVWIAIGFGGRRGFAMGAAIGLSYMVIGYAAYCLLSGSLSPPLQTVAEFFMGLLIGALSGAVIANIRPPSRRRSSRRKRYRTA